MTTEIINKIVWCNKPSGVPSYLLEEYFEGSNLCATGYSSNCNLPASSWITNYTNSGDIIFNATAVQDGHVPIEGTYCLWLGAGAGNIAQAVASFTSSDEVWVYFMWHCNSAWYAGYMIYLMSAADETILAVGYNTPSMNLGLLWNGSWTYCTTISFTNDWHLHQFWIHYKKNTGGDNGVAQLYYVLDWGTKPADPIAELNFSNGTSTDQASKIMLCGDNHNIFLYDAVKVSTSVLGDWGDLPA